jgi:hypothetical protein
VALVLSLLACEDPAQPGELVELDVTAIWIEAGELEPVSRRWQLIAPARGDCDGGTCGDDFGWRGEGRIPPDGAFRVTARVRCPDDDPLTLIARSKVGEDGPEICDVARIACSPEPQTLTEWQSCGGG